jgi:nitroimidazol reductase NimA-like FMN-containing flavoprotein (pyridoxamine 5'-phosphate oxidase superfamily)
MSRRDQIKMSDEEVDAFLGEQKTVICASNGHDGFPHLMPLWFVVRDGRIWAWTYARSQKVKNLERDPRATLQLETGTEYQELRGVMFRTRARIHRETDDVAALGTQIMARYYGGDPEDENVRAMVAQQAAKRVGLEFVEDGHRATWDHRKLGGTY